MKRMLAGTLLAFTVPLMAGPPAAAQAAPTSAATACPSDRPVAPPMGDVDQFVAFDVTGCPVPATEAVAVVEVTTASSDGPEPTTPAPFPLVPAAAPAAMVETGAEPDSEGVVTIPVEDGFVASTGPAEAEAAARPKPADYSQRLDSDYCAAVPWKCDADVLSFGR